MKEDLNILRDTVKELVFGTLDKAGKGKSEFIKILGREIGQALAAVLKEPLDQLVKTRKINVCIELVEREKGGGESTGSRDSAAGTSSETSERHAGKASPISLHSTDPSGRSRGQKRNV